MRRPSVQPIDSPALITSTPSDREIMWSREFKAPWRLVFDAWTRADLVPRWMTPPDWTIPECEVDLRPGGSFRYVMRRASGEEVVMHGRYHVVEPPERMVFTQAFDGFSEVGWRPQDEAVITMVLTEQDGRTTWTATFAYPSQEARDAVLQMGLQLDRFEALLAELTEDGRP